MFILVHFHTQPARNNHHAVCVRDRRNERPRDRKKHGKTTGGDMECENTTGNGEKEPPIKNKTERKNLQYAYVCICRS